MAQVVSAKEMKKIGKILKGQESLALISEDKSVQEGFFPVMIKNYIYYGLLTPKQLIFSKKTKGVRDEKSDLIPFQEIKDISLDWGRNKRLLLHILVQVICVPLVVSSVPFVIALMSTLELSGFLSAMPVLLEIMMWALIIELCILVPLELYRFFAGENQIRLALPDESLVLRCKYKHFARLGDLKLFRIPGAGLDYPVSKGNIKDLYNLLLKYVKA